MMQSFLNDDYIGKKEKGIEIEVKRYAEESECQTG